MPFSREQLDPREVRDIIIWFQLLRLDDLYDVWLKQNEVFEQSRE